MLMLAREGLVSHGGDTQKKGGGEADEEEQVEEGEEEKQGEVIGIRNAAGQEVGNKAEASQPLRELALLPLARGMCNVWGAVLVGQGWCKLGGGQLVCRGDGPLAQLGCHDGMGGREGRSLRRVRGWRYDGYGGRDVRASCFHYTRRVERVGRRGRAVACSIERGGGGGGGSLAGRGGGGRMVITNGIQRSPA